MELITTTGYFHIYIVLVIMLIAFIAGVFAEKIRVESNRYKMAETQLEKYTRIRNECLLNECWKKGVIDRDMRHNAEVNTMKILKQT